MGLDMYAYSVAKGILPDTVQVDMGEQLFKDGAAIEGVHTDFAYWRKFNSLHGWMEHLYYEKGGTDTEFNCAYVRLTDGDLTRLEKDATLGLLTPTKGFFFGDTETPFSDADREEVHHFVFKAKAVLAEGGAVVYSSWW